MIALHGPVGVYGGGCAELHLCNGGRLFLLGAVMALTSSSTLSDALDQYKDNLRYWQSADTAANLLEAVMYLLACRPETLAAAEQSVTHSKLDELRTRLEPMVVNAVDTRETTTFVRMRGL